MDGEKKTILATPYRGPAHNASTDKGTLETHFYPLRVRKGKSENNLGRNRLLGG